MSDNPLVIFHSMNGTMHCDDGFAAACVAKLGISTGEPEFFPGIYGQDPPLDRMQGRTVYLLDFSYKRPAMLDIVWKGKPERLVVLDHHKTAEAELAGFADEAKVGASCYVEFDMSHSGAILAWRYFFGNTYTAPELLQRIEDGDLWRFAYGNTKTVQAALRSYPQTFEVWLDLLERPIDELAAEGVAIRRFIDAKVREILPNARRMSVAGHEVWGVACPKFLASEIAAELAERDGGPFGVAYEDGATHRVYSLRSRGEFDVSTIAAKMGGGGHKNAAGYQCQLP